MMHSSDINPTDARLIRDAIVRDIESANGKLSGFTVREYAYYMVDIPTASRRRGESPVIPGSLFWR